MTFFNLKPSKSHKAKDVTLTAAAKNVLSPISDTKVMASDFVKPYKKKKHPD